MTLEIQKNIRYNSAWQHTCIIINEGVYILKNNRLKLFCVTLAAVLVMLSIIPFSANAASDTVKYEIPELSMTLDIPSDVRIIPQGIKQSDPIFSNNSFDYIQVMTKFRDHGDYYYGKSLTMNFEFELKVLANENKTDNFSRLSEKKQLALMENYSQQPDVLEYFIYKNETTAFMELSRSTTNTDGRFFSKEYCTIYEGYDITVKLTSQNDSLTAQENEIIKSIADSIRFPHEKAVDLSKLLTKAVVLPFCFIVVLFVILVIIKLRSIKQEQYRIQRKQRRLKERQERDEKEKSEAAEQANSSFLSENSDSITENSDSKNGINEKAFAEIDMDSAIANFYSESEETKRS